MIERSLSEIRKSDLRLFSATPRKIRVFEKAAKYSLGANIELFHAGGFVYARGKAKDRAAADNFSDGFFACYDNLQEVTNFIIED